MEKIGCKVIVGGHVQGVGFRYYTRREAVKQGLTGYAKNLNDGNVEVVLYGKRENINRMLEWLGQGPSTAYVDKTEISTIPYSDEYDFSCF
jgi:acylphosphatase